MKKYDLKLWAKAAGIRAVKTMAQSAVGLIGTSLVIVFFSACKKIYCCKGYRSYRDKKRNR